jgi:hypothetical protein
MRRPHPIRWLIVWLARRTRWYKKHPLTSWDPGDKIHRQVANRYMPFWQDEIQRGDDSIYLKLPRWLPFNVLLHHWRAHDDGPNMHDHPRRTLTICLRGQLIEKTPWGERVLRPGSVVWRSARYIHGFRVEPEHGCKTWTLFLVGRRRFCQNTYVVTRRTEAADRRA